MDSSKSYDVLVAVPESIWRSELIRAIRQRLKVRICSQPTAVTAFESYKHAQFDAIVCATDLANLDCWRLIALIRSGRFGYPDTPVFVICPAEAKAALEPMLDVYSTLIELESGDQIASNIASKLSCQAKHSILIIEDEPEAADVAFQALDRYFSVGIAQDGIVGLDAWRRIRHDLILLDLMLPGMTGSEVLSQIKQTQSEQAVIVLTAMDALDTHQDLILAGASEFLTKPIDTHLLPSVCARVLREKHCLRNAEEATKRATAFNTLAARLHAAEFNLSSGRTAEARNHLSHAMFHCRAQSPTDDEWLQLLNELSPPTTTR